MTPTTDPPAVLEATALRRAVVYLRVSTAAQADTDYGSEGFSIPAQREACWRTAERLQAAVVDEYVDRGESARSSARPALQRMLKRLQAQCDVDYVIVHKVDRLARSREDDVTIALGIRRSGAQLVSATENIDETPSGKLLHGIMATIAEFYSANLAAEARKGLQQKAKLGGTPGLAPVGYLNVIERIEGKEVRTVRVDSERAPHVQWAFEAFAEGTMTLRTLTEALDARGLVSRGTKRHASKALSLAQVHKLLRNPYYLGTVTFAGVEHEGRHQPLIDAELFYTVQDILTDRRKWGERPKKRTHYLKGSLACGLCRRKLSIGYSRGKGGVYAYFFCLGRHRDQSCRLPYLGFEFVESEVEEFWRGVRIEASELQATRELVRGHIRQTTQAHEAEQQRQRTRLQQLEAESRKLMQALYADAIPIELMREEQARIAREKAEAELVLESLTTERATLEASLDEALAMIEHASELYLGGDETVRRELNHALFSRLYIVPDGVAGADLASPYVQLLTDDLAERLQREATAVGSTAPDAVSETKKVILTPAGEGFVSSLPPAGGPAAYPLAQRLERPHGLLPAETENPAPFREPGSNELLLVGADGFELILSTDASKTGFDGAFGPYEGVLLMQTRS